MSNISFVNNKAFEGVQAAASSGGVQSGVEIRDVAKGAVQAEIIQSAPDENSFVHVIKQESLEASLIQANASATVKEDINALMQNRSLEEDIHILAGKDSISIQDVSNLYHKGETRRSTDDCMLLDFAASYVLMENLVKNSGKIDNAQCLTDISKDLNAFTACTKLDEAMALKAKLEASVNGLGALKDSPCVKDIQDFIANKLSKLEEASNVEKRMEDLFRQEGISKDKPAFASLDKNNMCGMGAVIRVQENLVEHFESVNAASIKNYLTEIRNNTGKAPALNYLYENAPEGLKDEIRALSREKAAALSERIKNEAVTAADFEQFSKEISKLRDLTVLPEDTAQIDNALAEKKQTDIIDKSITDFCKQHNLDETQTVSVKSSIQELAKAETSLADRLNSLRNFVQALFGQHISMDDIDTFLAPLTQLLPAPKELKMEFDAIKGYLVLQPLLKDDPLLAGKDIGNITFNDLKEFIVKTLQTETGSKEISVFSGLLVSVAYELYQNEQIVQGADMGSFEKFLDTFGTVKEKLQKITPENIHIFNSAAQEKVANFILLAQKLSINTRQVVNALKSFDGQAKFERVVNEYMAIAKDLLGISSTGNFSMESIKPILQKKLQDTPVVQKNQDISALNEAKKVVTGSYDELIGHPLVKEIMTAQNVSKVENLKGETLAVSLQICQHVLIKSLGDLSDYQLNKLGLYSADLSNMNTLKTAIDNILSENNEVAGSFEFAALLHTYFSCTGMTEADQKAFFAEYGISEHVQGQVQFIASPLENKLPILSHLKMQDLHIDMNKFRTEWRGNNTGIGEAIHGYIKDLTTGNAAAIETARKSMLEALKNDPIMQQADLMVKIKHHKEVDNTKAMARALGKVLNGHDILQVENIMKLYERENILKIGLAQRQILAASYADKDMGDILKGYNQKLLDQCMNMALLPVCIEFDSPDKYQLLHDYVAGTGVFTDTRVKDSFKTGVVKQLTDLGLDQNVAEALFTNRMNRESALKLKIEGGLKNFSLKAGDKLEAVSHANIKDRIKKMGELHKNAMNILAELQTDQAITIDTKSGVTVGFGITEDIDASVGIDIGNALTLSRDEHGKPVIGLGSELAVSFGVEAGLTDALSVEASLGAGVKGFLNLQFANDNDASIFIAKVLTRLVDKSDLGYVESANIAKGGGANVEVKATVDLAGLVGAEVVSVEAGVGFSAGISFTKENHRTHNELHGIAYFNLTAEASPGLSDDTKEKALGAISDNSIVQDNIGEAAGRVVDTTGLPERFSASKRIGMQRDYIAKTDLKDASVTGIQVKETLTVVDEDSLEMFCAKYPVSAEQKSTLFGILRDEQRTLKNVVVTYEYDPVQREDKVSAMQVLYRSVHGKDVTPRSVSFSYVEELGNYEKESGFTAHLGVVNVGFSRSAAASKEVETAI